MSVLVYINTLGGNVAKNACEAVYYGSKNGETTVVTNGGISDDELIKFGEVDPESVPNAAIF